jgi:ABC-type multidrug transport system fused ATPase/permease subunit
MAYRPLRDLAEARLAWALGGDAYQAIERAIVATPDGRSPASPEPGRNLDGRSPASPEPGRNLDARSPGELHEAGLVPSWPLATLELRGIRLARGHGERLSLRIEPGSVVAVCGATGVGKTTLLRTLLGLERPLEGHIVYDDVPIEDRAAGPHNRPFAWVPQDAPLLADTLFANVLLGRGDGEELPACPEGPGITRQIGAESAARQALRSVGAEHIADAIGVERLEGGGRSVSGGERQWIALARAVATQQPILLLDEPTSAMDSESQHRVLEAIRHLRGRRTVVIVTHRLEPLAIADAVVRLGQDEVIGQAA